MHSGSAPPPGEARRTRAPARSITAGSPADAALRILRCRFGKTPVRARDGAGAPAASPWQGANGFTLAPFQAAGARWIGAALDHWGGALLADDVGLGKTFTALEVVRGGILKGRPVTIVVPVTVRAHWLSRLAAMRATLPADRAAAVAGVQVLTHGQLSRARTGLRAAASPGGGAGLVVVDEAHAFRNPRTRRYRALAALCRSTQVLLVTATPVNNSLWDLYFLIRLWAGDGVFAALGVADLKALFARLADGAATATGRAPASFRRLIAAFVLRRSRSIVADAFPVRRAPVAVRYALRDVYGRALPAALASIASLRLPWFALGDGSGAASRSDGAPLLRLMLLKRLESSATAFRLSATRLAWYNDLALGALRAGTLLLPRAARGGGAAADTDQLLIPGLVGAPVPGWIDTARVGADAHADGRALARLLDSIAGGRGGGDDPKLAALEALLEAIDDEPAIVFTGFRDTAEYLSARLAGRPRVALLHGSGGAIGRQSAPRPAVIARFAPRANGCRPPPAAERIDVLVATDALSEGLNLQDAACVISYDLPWNPVRLVQRVGRIDRLGSPHAAISICNFMPDAELDELLRLGERLGAKLDAVRLVTGSGATAAAGLADPARVPDTQADTLPYEDDPLNRLWRTAADVVDGGPRDGAGARVTGARGTGARPIHARMRRAAGDPAGVAVFSCGPQQLALAATAQGTIRVMETDELAALLTRALQLRLVAAAGPPPPWLDSAARAAARRYRGARVPASPSGRLARQVARRMLQAIAEEGGDASSVVAARADAALARLRTGLRVGDQLELQRRLDRGHEMSAAELIDAVLEGAEVAAAAAQRRPQGAPRLVAVIELTACAVDADSVAATSG